MSNLSQELRGAGVGLRRVDRAVRRRLDSGLRRAGIGQTESRIARDAQKYWRGDGDTRWHSNSHWRHGGRFSDEQWLAVGREHLAMFDQLSRTADGPRSLRRVVEWGCGGGANAVHFAPRADEFVGVDVSASSVAECGRQVKAECDTNFVPVLADVASPEAAAKQVPGPCDLFLCLYVLELVPTPEYGLRFLHIAGDLLRPGGVAFVQIKYSTDSWQTRSRRRNYAQGLANMTTYRIEEFWDAAVSCGLRPDVVKLVPKNELDKRYAYFILTKE